MAHAIAPDYGQQFLFPPAIEDWVGADHPARFLREFVDQLDLPGLGFSMSPGEEGRPGYAPSLMLKIWLYGYFHRIRSTRKLEVACREHISLIWLSGMIAPDHNSLWRFWRENQKALRGVFKQSVEVALGVGCVGLAIQALDGTKIEAAAQSHGGWSKQYMEKVLAALDASLDQTELSLLQEQANGLRGEYRLPAGIGERKALREQIQRGLQQLAADGRNHYQPVEPEARRMKVRQNNRYAYNAQAVADSMNGVITACEVTREETDNGQLVPMIEQSRQNLGPGALQTLTLSDTGYGGGADLQEAQEKGMLVLVAPAEGKPVQGNPYASQYFIYEPGERTVTCPRGERLDYEGHTVKRGMPVERYRCHCRDCPVRAKCTRDPKGRQIQIWPHTAIVQAMRKRLRSPEGRKLYALRRQIIERTFAGVKQHDGFRRWTLWGLEAVRTQWSIICTTVNLRILYTRWLGSEKKPSPPRFMAMRLKVAQWTEKAFQFGSRLIPMVLRCRE